MSSQLFESEHDFFTWTLRVHNLSFSNNDSIWNAIWRREGSLPGSALRINLVYRIEESPKRWQMLINTTMSVLQIFQAQNMPESFYIMSRKGSILTDNELVRAEWQCMHQGNAKFSTPGSSELEPVIKRYKDEAFISMKHKKECLIFSDSHIRFLLVGTGSRKKEKTTERHYFHRWKLGGILIFCDKASAGRQIVETNEQPQIPITLDSR